MLQYEACFLTKFPDRCGVIKWTNFRYRAECDTKKRALPKGRTRGRGLSHVVCPIYFLPSVEVIGACVMRKGSVYMGKMPTRMGSLTF